MDATPGMAPSPMVPERIYEHLVLSQRASCIGSWEYDVATGALWCSEEFHRIFGLEPGSIRTLQDFAATRGAERQAVFEANVAESLRTGVPLTYEVYANRPDGTGGWARGRGAVYLGEVGKLTRLVGSLEDVTELKRVEADLATATEELQVVNAALERQKEALVAANAALLEQTRKLEVQGEALHQANRAKDEFLSLLSHELRTPIGTIQGTLSLLARQEAAPAVLDGHRRIGLAAQALATLVNDLLSAAQLQAGSLQLTRRPFEPAELLADAIDEMVPLAEAKGVSLVGPAQAPMGTFLGDRHRLAQVLRNLLFNAIRHTPEGGEVRLGGQASGGALVITVADTGDGLDVERVGDRLFQRFVTDQAAEGGVGLGLYVVKELVEAHGGEVAVASELGVGTTFTLRLPPG